MSGSTCLKCLSPLGKSSASLGRSGSDLWCGMVSHKSHASELKTGCLGIQKIIKKKKIKKINAQVSGFSQGSFGRKVRSSHPKSSHIKQFFDLAKVSKITTYSESEEDSNFAINSVSDFESASESDS